MMATITCAKTGNKTYLIIYNSVVTNNLLRMTLTMFSHDDQTFMVCIRQSNIWSTAQLKAEMGSRQLKHLSMC